MTVHRTVEVEDHRFDVTAEGKAISVECLLCGAIWITTQEPNSPMLKWILDTCKAHLFEKHIPPWHEDVKSKE